MYDLNTIKSVPCSDIARRHGIQLKESYGRLWGKLRPEDKTASFNINIKKNIWFDFGISQGGSNIDLVMHLDGISKTEAINKIANDFGITNDIDSNKWHPLTDDQYKDLGIQPERATLNFNFDLNKHTVEQLEHWSNKYGMPVSDLAEKFPSVYNKMVEKIGLNGINQLKQSYLKNLTQLLDPALNYITKEFLFNVTKDIAADLNKKVDLLHNGITYKKDFSNLKVDYENDFKQIIKEISNADKNISQGKTIEQIIDIYKNNLNFKSIQYFTQDQVRALRDFNKALFESDNKFLPINSIKKAYKELGNNLDNLEKDYKSIIKEGQTISKDDKLQYNKWESNIDHIRSDMINIKYLFNTCSTIIEGIREANITIKNDSIKNTDKIKSIDNSLDLSP